MLGSVIGEWVRVGEDVSSLICSTSEGSRVVLAEGVSVTSYGVDVE